MNIDEIRLAAQAIVEQRNEPYLFQFDCDRLSRACVDALFAAEKNRRIAAEMEKIVTEAMKQAIADMLRVAPVTP